MALLNIHTFSKIISSQSRFMVIYPEHSKKEELPVLYLLHGGMEDCMAWISNTGIERYAMKKEIAVVMPSAGPSRWLNMSQGPAYGDYVIEELPQTLRRFFPRLSIKREKTYIGGLSMGGGGALELAMMYPERFAKVCVLSTSSVIPLEHLRQPQGYPAPPGGNGAPSLPMIHLGVEDPDMLAGTRYDVLHQSLQNIKDGKALPHIFHAIGTEDHGFEVGLALRKHFLSIKNNPYHYEFHTEPAPHDWSFWDKWIQVFIEHIQ